MKLSIEQANKLLAQLIAGVTVAEDEQTADSHADIDAIAANINEVVAKNMRPELTEEMKASSEAAFTARYLGALRSAAHRVFSVPRKEMEQLSLEQLLSKCKGTLDSRYTQTDAERQTQLETTVQEYEQQIEDIKAQHEEQLKEETAKFIQKDISSRCMSIVQQLPRKGGDIEEQAEMLKYKMQKVYEVRYNEATKQLELYKEGQPATDENNKPIKDEDFARSWAERAGILVRDTRHISPADVQAEHQEMYAGVSLNDEDMPANGMNAIEVWAEG